MPISQMSSRPLSRQSNPNSQMEPDHQPLQAAKDHIVSAHRHRLSQKSYPEDCPPLRIRWHYAVDVPKRKPFEADPSSATATTDAPVKKPKQYVAFTALDSAAIEDAYQKLIAEEDAALANPKTETDLSHGIEGLGLTEEEIEAKEKERRVPVNEDYLFDVDIKRRELVPAYWVGSTYDVRRGTWFFQEGTTMKPCDENLATQIEEGYIRLAPFRKPKTDSSASTDGANGHQQKTWRLLGAHMSSFVVYVDSNTAWLLSDDFYGKISSTVYQRITAGSHLGGYRLVRGYTEGDAPETKTESSLKAPSTDSVRPKTPPEKPSLKLKPSQPDLKYKRRSMPPLSTGTFPSDDALNGENEVTSPSIENARRALERKMSSFGIDEDEEGDILEGDMKEDYDNKGDGANNQAREIDHLILVTHGIGQRLSMRMESVNFVHDVNVFRKTLKSVYSHSTGLQALNNDLQTPKETKNCRIQVLPVCWRHLVDFPQKPLPPQGTDDHDAPYPSLQDITVEGVPAVRGLIADLALDVLLYQSPQYRTEIERVVLSECERIVSEFKRRNPNWRGKVSLVGHSLGSAIFFDLLEAASFSGHTPPSTTPSQSQKAALPNHTPAPGSPFTFPIQSLFALGSPIALFCLLRGQRLAEPEAPRYNLYNIFHPTDPISYRIEPLIAPQTARIKPQALPYTKKNFLSAASGWSGGVGESIQQGVSGWWRGVASKMLSRSMGIDEAQTEQSAEGMVRSDSGLSLPESFDGSRPSTAKKNSDEGASIPNLEGLINIPAPQAVPPAAKDALSKWNPLKRVDYAIQEGTFEISLIASIASHLGYWADEDVAHFLLGQVLSGEKEKEDEAWLGEREEGDISGQVEAFGRRGRVGVGAKRK